MVFIYDFNDVTGIAPDIDFFFILKAKRTSN